MSGLTFDEIELESQLADLSEDGQLAFGLLCCERMLPNYIAFSEQSAWGDPSVLRHALDVGWGNLVDGTLDVSLSALKEQCDQSAPDTEEFQTILVSPALDAAVAIATLIEFIEARNVRQTVTIACLARDTVDMYVQELEDMAPNASNLEERIRLHDLMQRELQSQQDDLVRVRGAFEKQALRDTFRNRGNSNIAIA